MDLIFLIAKIKITNFFQLKNWYIFLIIFFLVGWYYYNLPFLKLFLIQSDFQHNYFKHFLIVIFGLATVLRKICTNSFITSKFIPPYFPLSTFKKYIFKLVFELFSIYFFNSLLLISLLKLNISILHLSDLIKVVLSILNGIIISEVIYFFPKSMFNWRSIVAYGPLFSLFILTTLLFKNQSFLTIYCENIYLITVYIFFSGLILETNNTCFSVRKTAWHTFQVKPIFISLSIYIKNRPLKISALFLCLIKGFMLFQISFHFGNSHSIPPYLIYIFLMPVPPFTYFLNNIWGFTRCFWMRILLSSPNLKRLFFHQLKISAPPLLIDFLLSAIFIYYNSFNFKNPYLLCLIYIICLFVFCVFSFFWALIFPKYIDKVLSLNSPTTTSFISSICTITVTCLCSLVEYSLYFLVFPISIGLLALILMLNLNQINLNERIRLAYLKLFN